jgi:serine protease Do
MKKVVTMFMSILIILLTTSCGVIYIRPDFNEYSISSRTMNPSFIYDNVVEAMNKLNDGEYITANVLIESKSLDGMFNLISAIAGQQGSGVVFYETNEFYYALTNAHVVSNYDALSNRITVTDYYNNRVFGFIYEDSYQEDYDLAVVFFPKHNVELYVMEIGEYNLWIGQDVIAIGNPEGERNIISKGKINGFEYVIINDNDEGHHNQLFKYIAHSAKIRPGSSGGMLIDLAYNLIGINTAAQTDSNDEFIEGYAIPADVIMDYLDEFVYVELNP